MIFWILAALMVMNVPVSRFSLRQHEREVSHLHWQSSMGLWGSVFREFLLGMLPQFGINLSEFSF